MDKWILMDKVTICSTVIGNHTLCIEWYYVWRPLLTSKHVVQFVSDSCVSCKFLWYLRCNDVSLFHSRLKTRLFLCNQLHWGNCWMGTVGSRGHGFWHWERQWSCRRFTRHSSHDELKNLELLTSQNFQSKSWVLRLRQRVCWKLAAANVIIWTFRI